MHVQPIADRQMVDLVGWFRVRVEGWQWRKESLKREGGVRVMSYVVEVLLTLTLPSDDPLLKGLESGSTSVSVLRRTSESSA